MVRNLDRDHALLPLDEVRVSVLDRSFLFGDAVYEVVRVYGGKPFLMGEHLDRMVQVLGDPLPQRRVVPIEA